MFSIPSPTQSLQARPPQPGMPGGVTPELIQLLAQMKVKQQTDAAARDLAMKQGQQPPTVAEGLQKELEGNATTKIMQKMAPQGLAALTPPGGAPQGQNTQAQQAQQMAAGQPQQMARGGVVALRSNLPQHYAQGGIVAFDGGGTTSETEMAEWRRQRRGETDGDYALRMEGGPNFNKANPDSFGAGVAEWLRNSLGQAGDDARALVQRPGDARMQQPVRQNMENDPRFIGAQEDPAAAPDAPPPAPQQDIVDLATRGGAGASQRASMSGGMSNVQMDRPVMSAEDTALKDATQKRVMAGMDVDPEARKAAAYEEMKRLLGPDQAAALANQKQGLEKLQALQEAGQAQRPGSFLRGLQLMGKNMNTRGGFGGAMQGVSEGIDASNAGYNKEDIGFQEKLNTLQAAMDKAKHENNIGVYNAAKGAYDDAIKEKEAYTRNATSMVNTNENSMARKQGAYDTAQARMLQTKEMHARASEAATSRSDWKAQKMLEMRAQAAEKHGATVAAQEAKLPKNQVDDSFDPAARAAVVAADQLAKDPIYQDTLKKLGISLPKPDNGAPSGAGWSAKLK